MNVRMEGNAAAYNELYGSSVEAKSWVDASSRREKLNDYMMCRKSFDARIQSERSLLRTIMTTPGPVTLENNSGLTYMLDQIVDNRIELSKRSAEFHKSYGDDIESFVEKSNEAKTRTKYGIRSKDEILIDCIRIYDDPYASFIAGGVNIDSDKNDHALDVKAVYGASVRKEWERCYPQDDFYDAYDDMLKRYNARQKKDIKDYIDTMDYLDNLDRMSDYYSSEGMITDWKKTRMKIGAAIREKNNMQENWRKRYGKDSIRKAAYDKYEEIYPGRQKVSMAEVELNEFDDELVM